MDIDIYVGTADTHGFMTLVRQPEGFYMPTTIRRSNSLRAVQKYRREWMKEQEDAGLVVKGSRVGWRFGPFIQVVLDSHFEPGEPVDKWEAIFEGDQWPFLYMDDGFGPTKLWTPHEVAWMTAVRLRGLIEEGRVWYARLKSTGEPVYRSVSA